MTAARRTVAVWRSELGTPSETFIVNQVAAMRRWSPHLVGMRQYAGDGLALPADHTELDPRSSWGRVQHAALWRAGVNRSLLRLLRRPDVGLLHAHFTVEALVVQRAARLARCPLVVTAHGYDVTTTSGSMTGERAGRWLELVEQAAAFVAVSEFIAGRLSALGVPDDKIAVHRIGIPVPPLPAARPRHGIVFVGRLVEKKGCDDLLRAAAALPAQVRAPIRIIGDGPLRGSLEQLADELDVDATFVGRRPPTAVAEELAAAAVFCAPSKVAADGDAEGYGMVFLEAAAARTPSVTYDSGGTAEAVVDGRTGLVVPERDIAGLTEALRSLLADPPRAQALGEAGRRRVVDELDVLDLTAHLEDLYDRVARPAR